MITLVLGPGDLEQVRFAFSPLWETVMSLRALGSGTAQMHRPWIDGAARRLRAGAIDVQLLTDVVRPTGYIPDFLVPSPVTGRPRMHAALGQVGASAPGTVAEQLHDLASFIPAESTPHHEARVARIRALADAPEAAIDRVVHELGAYHRTAIAPVWPRIESLLQADLSHRLGQLASGGLRELLRTLHPLIAVDADRIMVTKDYDDITALGGRGLLLVPCVFAWPDVIVQTIEPHTPTLSYSPRGVARLWTTSPTRDRSALVDVLGRTRATLLAGLDLPISTTQLSEQLELRPPTVNAHLKSLLNAGIVTSRRDGRRVLYTRSALGDALLRGNAS